MYSEVEARFQKLIDLLQKNGTDTSIVNKAYLKAKELHNGQMRKDGKPYISHPVEVALILAKQGFSDEVICAALLHDVIEDCGLSKEKLKSLFNDQIANLVDCVSTIDEAKFKINTEDLFELEDFEKASVDEQSFKKLIKIGKQNPLGFYIKFADRLHNLRTISSFDYNKQLEKVKETEKWILPIAKLFKAKYFYEKISNECFKILHKFDGCNFFEEYNHFVELNGKNIVQTEDLFKNALLGSNISDIKIKNVCEYEVFKSICKNFGKVGVSKISQSQINKVPVFIINIFYKNSDLKENVVTVYDFLCKNKYIVIDYAIDEFSGFPYFVASDQKHNKFKVYLYSKSEYVNQNIGMVSGISSEYIDDENLDNLNVELIRVKTRSGEVKYIQKDSTVLDFAFKIHKDIGFGFKYAIVNKSKTKCPPYTRLYDGDQVEIIVERDGETIVNNAILNWLAYVNTELAKKLLIKHFQKLLK